MSQHEPQADEITNVISTTRTCIRAAKTALVNHLLSKDGERKIKELPLVMHMLNQLDDELETVESHTCYFSEWIIHLAHMWLVIAEQALSNAFDPTKTTPFVPMKKCMDSRREVLEALDSESACHTLEISETANNLVVFKRPVRVPNEPKLSFPWGWAELHELIAADMTHVGRAYLFIRKAYHADLPHLDTVNPIMTEWLTKTHDAIVDHVKNNEATIKEKFQSVCSQIGPIPDRRTGR